MAACAQGDSDQAKSSLKAAELPGCARFNEILTVTSSFEPEATSVVSYVTHTQLQVYGKSTT